MSEAERRWRLLLGRFSDKRLPDCLGAADRARDGALDYLYGREYQRRGITPQGDGGKSGSLDPGRIKALDWLTQVQHLFPVTVSEQLTRDAIDRYDISDLLKDPKVLDGAEASPSLLRAVLSFRDRGDPELQAQIRSLAQRIIDELLDKLKAGLARSMSGRRNRHARSPMKSAANFDATRTIRANLKHWDAGRRTILAEQLHFFSRQRRQLDWTIILCIDQSGSMTDSLIFSTLIAAVLTGLPGVRVKMVLFDTAVLDVTDRLDDPLSLLLSVQLGGGTNIGRAVQYCETLVETPTRTVFALVSDFREGASRRPLLAGIARLGEARVRQVGIAALDNSGRADFDRTTAQALADIGMNVAAMSPDGFADWLAEVMG